MELQNSIRVGICLDIAKEVMKLDSDVLGPWVEFGSLGKFQAACIVFEAFGINFGFRKLKINVERLQVFQQM